MDLYTDAELKGFLFYQLDKILETMDKSENYISRKDFLQIIWRAKAKYREIQDQNIRKELLNPKEKTLAKRIKALMICEKPVYSIQELTEKFQSLGEDYTNKDIGTALSQDKANFRNLEDLVNDRGVYCRVGYDPNELDLKPYIREIKKTRKLIMEGS